MTDNQHLRELLERAKHAWIPYTEPELVAKLCESIRHASAVLIMEIAANGGSTEGLELVLDREIALSITLHYQSILRRRDNN